ncbi:MAG: LamG domain-containing protein [Chloroflexi bacterium]|nr:LamG domain-containing protein [Chloroflexota bacterium]MDA8189771.1 LamG domain-containing protein [Dehalococcoidales bacterium]
MPQLAPQLVEMQQPSLALEILRLGGEVPDEVPPSPLLNNLVAYWKLEEPSGTRVDAMGGGHDLTDNNTVGQAVGKIGNAASFVSANSESLSRSDVALAMGGRDYSMSLWFYASSWTTFPWFVTRWKSSIPIDGVYAGVYTDGTYRFTGYAAGSVMFDVAGASPLSVSTWYHMVCVHDWVGKRAYVYLNNVSNSVTFAAASGDDEPFALGGALTEHFTDGRIDEVGFWTRVLAPAEVAQLYNNGNGLPYPFR